MMKAATQSISTTIETALLRLLGHRYGDGLVYLGDDTERGLFAQAINLGFISREGYLTRAGRSLLARHEDD